MINVLAYADDLVLCAPSWLALQQLLNVLSVHIKDINMTCNVNKSVCMVFEPQDRKKVVAKHFSSFQIDGTKLKFVDKFKYLDHVLKYDMSDDDDMLREVRNMFYRSNILVRKFAKCSRHVKLMLFKSYCINLYGIALWKDYKASSLLTIKSCYHRCIKIFFGFDRHYSVTNMLLELGLPSFNTILANNIALLDLAKSNCNNTMVQYSCKVLGF